MGQPIWPGCVLRASVQMADLCRCLPRYRFVAASRLGFDAHLSTYNRLDKASAQVSDTSTTTRVDDLIIQVLHYIARSKMQNAENAREHLRPRTSPSSFMKHSSGEGASICSSQRGLVGVAQHRNAVCLFALRTWQSRRASGCSVTPESPVVQGSACGRLHCANTSGSTNCRQRLLSLSERRHGIAIGAGLHALVPVDAGATEVSAEASRGNARCKPQALRIRCSETADIPAHLCRHRLRFLGFAHPKQAVGRAESTLLACAGAAHERTALPLATSTGEDVRCGACQAARRERRSTDH